MLQHVTIRSMTVDGVDALGIADLVRSTSRPTPAAARGTSPSTTSRWPRPRLGRLSAEPSGFINSSARLHASPAPTAWRWPMLVLLGTVGRDGMSHREASADSTTDGRPGAGYPCRRRVAAVARLRVRRCASAFRAHVQRVLSRRRCCPRAGRRSARRRSARSWPGTRCGWQGGRPSPRRRSRPVGPEVPIQGPWWRELGGYTHGAKGIDRRIHTKAGPSRPTSSGVRPPKRGDRVSRRRGDEHSVDADPELAGMTHGPAPGEPNNVMVRMSLASRPPAPAWLTVVEP